MSRLAYSFCLLSCYICICSGFMPNHQMISLHHSNGHKFSDKYGLSTITKTKRPEALFSNLDNDDLTSNIEKSNQQTNVFILSYDGVIANTAHTRACIAMDAALQTWPFLQETESMRISSDRTWLTNKLQALLHVTQDSNEGLMGCEAVLLARLLIEEQELDQGKSVGKTGKYASKFHPSSSPSAASAGRRSNTNGSRPLTVGEIAANWVDGANLVDSLFIKYNIEGKSPLPFIRRNIISLQEEKAKTDPPPLIPEIAEALANIDNKVYVVLAHPSQTELAMSSLSSISSSSIPMEVADESSKTNNGGSITIVPPKDDFETQDDIIERLVGNEMEGSYIMVIQSVLKTLIRSKRLLGDDSPRFINGFGDCIVGENIRISFSLPLWADNTDPQQHNDAIMNPWLDVISKGKFLEMMRCEIPLSSR